jgi:hypothetical protein
MGSVIGVVGGSGGVGASSFAAVLAAVAGPAVLVDLDGAGGGLDVLLGIEAVGGARWSGLHLAGGRLDPGDLVGGLPGWGPVVVLAADVVVDDPGAVVQVLGAAAAAGPVVVDLPRADTAARAAALLMCELAVVLARADVGGLVAAHLVAAGLSDRPRGVVLRRGEVAGPRAAEVVGCPLLGTLPPLGRARPPLDPWRPPRAAARVATGILRGVPA